MKDMVDSLVRMEKKTSKSKGNYTLFALVLREDSPDVWDLVVSAPWIWTNRWKALKFLAGEMNKVLNPEDILKISKIVPMRKESPFEHAIHSMLAIEHAPAELKNCFINGIPVRHAFVITSRKQESAQNVRGPRSSPSATAN